MFRFLRFAAAVALPAAMFVPMFAAPAHAVPATLTVDDNNAQCPEATFTTISAAVTAANAGDTIQVCAGIYAETVTVSKQLTFLGAKSGVDGRGLRGNLTKESVVNSINGDFIIPGGVDGVTIDGFTIQGAGSDAVGADGVESFAGSSGLTLQNNVIRDNLEGINFQNPNGNLPALITRNAFINNDNGTTAEGGTGVFISNGPANNTQIVSNSFKGHRETAINFAGSPNHSVGLVVSNNKSVDDSTFVVATNSDNALVESNKVTHAATGNGSGILDFGSNNSLTISHNTINGGAGANTSGIRVADFTGTPSVGTKVITNTVIGRYYGIRSTGNYTTLFIGQNTVKSAAQVGIDVEAGSGNSITRNNVSLSANRACQDLTTGPLTGTANTWSHNNGHGSPSFPAGICS
ncbi:MAG: hypothetical protein JWL83_714 [Actinomycetia bacterium]|nr:hypothetical protein [Actinomycetes bacterium]